MIGTWLLLTAMVTLAGPDAVLLKNGERLEGTVVEASPSFGVRLRLPDGSVRWLHPMAVERVERAGEPPAPPTAAPPSAPSAAAPPEQALEPTPAEPAPPEAAPAPSPPRPARPESLSPEPGRPEADRRPRFVPRSEYSTWTPVTPADPSGYRRPSVGPPQSDIWLSFAIGSSSPFGNSGPGSSSLQALTGGDHVLISGEAGLRLDGRNSIGAVVDASFGGAGAGLRPVCDDYGTDCSTATAQLGLFLRHDLAPTSRINPWGSVGIGYEWLEGDVFTPYEGVGSIEVLHASGLQFARLGAGIDWRMGAIGLGLYATVALGSYGDVAIDGVDVGGGQELHGWAQAGLRAILWP